jgi:hypothetical protein
MLNIHEQLQLGIKAVELNTHNIEDFKKSNIKFLNKDRVNEQTKRQNKTIYCGRFSVWQRQRPEG